MKWDRKQIESILPQREPFIFVDEVVEIEGTSKVVAVKYITKDENYFTGHFPGRPVMPGVLIIEALAQTSIILYSLCKPDVAITHPDYYLGKVKAEFIAPAGPGDALFLEAVKVKIINNAGIVDALARVDDNVIVKASLVFGIKKSE